MNFCIMDALADYKMIPSLLDFSGSLICSILFLIDEYNNDRLGEWRFSFSLLRIMVLMNLGLIYIFPMLRRMMFFELVYLVWEDAFMYF